EALVFALGDIARDTLSLKNHRELEAVFLDALKDSDALVRRSAVYGLGCLGSTSDATRAALDDALLDTNSVVRQNAAWALGQIGAALGPKQSELVLTSLGKALRDGDPFVKRDAAN